MSRRPDLAGAGQRWNQDGFTLIETLVAFVVTATLVAVLFRGVVTLRAGAFAFGARLEEEIVARAILDDALANRNLRAGTYSGVRDGRRWTMVAKAVDLSGQLPATPRSDTTSISPQPPGPGALAPSPPDPSTAQQSNWSPQRLIIRVETHGRPLEVDTIRLSKSVPER